MPRLFCLCISPCFYILHKQNLLWEVFSCLRWPSLRKRLRLKQYQCIYNLALYSCVPFPDHLLSFVFAVISFIGEAKPAMLKVFVDCLHMLYLGIKLRSTLPATIHSFVKQNLNQHINRTSLYFKNLSRL